MRILKWTLFLTTIFSLPVVLVRKMRHVRIENDENIRYDINDYMADQGL